MRVRPGRIASVILLLVYGVMILYPLFFLTISAMKSNEAIFITPWALPESLDLSSFVRVWTEFNLDRHLLNSVYYAVTSTLVVVVISAMASYAIVRMKWRLRGVVLGMFLLGLMIPLHSQLVPIYIIFARLGIREPRLSLPLVYIAFAMPVTIFIISGYFRTIPRDLEESAVIEGASLIRSFFTIIVPIAKPAIATVLIFDFITIWNDFFAALVFATKESDKPIQLAVASLRGVFVTNYSLLLSAVVIAIVPSVIIYILLQDKIVEGMTAGALKG